MTPSSGPTDFASRLIHLPSDWVICQTCCQHPYAGRHGPPCCFQGYLVPVKILPAACSAQPDLCNNAGIPPPPNRPSRPAMDPVEWTPLPRQRESTRLTRRARLTAVGGRTALPVTDLRSLGNIRHFPTSQVCPRHNTDSHMVSAQALASSKFDIVTAKKKKSESDLFFLRH